MPLEDTPERLHRLTAALDAAEAAAYRLGVAACEPIIGTQYDEASAILRARHRALLALITEALMDAAMPAPYGAAERPPTGEAVPRIAP